MSGLRRSPCQGQLRSHDRPHDAETVTITINGVSVTAPITGGSFSATFDTHALPSSVTPYAITYAYAGNDVLASAGDNSTTLTVTGIPPYLSATTLVFGNEGLGLTSAPKTVRSYNYSGGVVSATVPASNGPFTVRAGRAVQVWRTKAPAALP